MLSKPVLSGPISNLGHSLKVLSAELTFEPSQISPAVFCLSSDSGQPSDQPGTPVGSKKIRTIHDSLKSAAIGGCIRCVFPLHGSHSQVLIVCDPP